jgi:hypothetical protein
VRGGLDEGLSDQLGAGLIGDYDRGEVLEEDWLPDEQIHGVAYQSRWVECGRSSLDGGWKLGKTVGVDGGCVCRNLKEV